MARTLSQWREAILAWHTTGASNGPVEGLNSMIKKGETSRRRVPQPHQLPHPNTARRRRLQLGTTPHPTPLNAKRRFRRRWCGRANHGRLEPPVDQRRGPRV